MIRVYNDTMTHVSLAIRQFQGDKTKLKLKINTKLDNHQNEHQPQPEGASWGPVVLWKQSIMKIM